MRAMLLDESGFRVIGTFDIDPRSKERNSEIVFISDDQPALAAAVRESILERTGHSATIAPEGDLDWPPSLEHMSPELLFEIETKDRVLFHLTGVPSSMMDFLSVEDCRVGAGVLRGVARSAPAALGGGDDGRRKGDLVNGHR